MKLEQKNKQGERMTRWIVAAGFALAVCAQAVVADSYHAVGNWQIRSSTSPFDDSKTVTMELYSLDEIPDRIGRSGKPKLYLRCKENTTNAFITFAGNFMADIQGYGRVRYRLDSDAAVTKRMQVSTDNEALGLWSGGTAIPFIKDMFGHETMILSATPYNQSAYTMSFDVKKLEEAIKPLREACHW